MAGADFVDIKKCQQCKREFVVPLGGREDYVYKLRSSKNGTINYYCSWTCYKIAKRRALYRKSKMTTEEQNWLKWARGK